MRWLNNVGRRNRSKKDVKLENFITEMQRLTLVHERDAQGESYYRLAAGPSGQEEKKAPEKGQAAKAGETRDKAEEAQKTGKGKKDDAQEKGDRVEPQEAKEEGNGAGEPGSERADNASAQSGQDKPENREGAQRREDAGNDDTSSS